MEEEKKEVKMEKPKRSTKSKVMTVFLCISFFCVLSILLYLIFGGVIPGKEKAPQVDYGCVDGTTDCLNPKQEKISYEVKNSKLYVNNKVVDHDGSFETSNDRIFDLGDLLLVGDCRSTCDWYFIDANASIVGSLGKPTQTDYSTKELVTPRFNTLEIEEVKDKIIYFYAYGYTTQDSSSICKYGENDMVYAKEQVKYKGNKTFESTQLTSSKTRIQVMQEDQRFICE